MNNRESQTGITLVMSLIMLVVLTLLVVSAIRFGNINLKIAGNAQVEAEASAATQVAIEKMILQVSAATDIGTVPAQSFAVSTGGGTYTVAVRAPVCNLSRNILTTELDPGNVNDRPCYENPDTDAIFDANNKKPAGPTACKDQQWDIGATYDDTSSSGAKVSMLQGMSIRVGAQVQCP